MRDPRGASGAIKYEPSLQRLASTHLGLGAYRTTQRYHHQNQCAHDADRNHSPLPFGMHQTQDDHAEGDQRRPDVHQHDGTTLAVAAFQQPVVQVLLVREEPPLAGVGPTDEGQGEIEERQGEYCQRQYQGKDSRNQAAASVLQL